jgi:DNA-binding MarR family transcriptional regulator
MKARARAAELRQVFDNLVRFETVLWAAIDARLRRDCGIGLGNLNVLMVIDATPECRVNDVATALAITVGGTSQAIDRIEAKGWCVRRPNPDDRRSSILLLTSDGKAILATAGRVFDEELDRYLRVPLSVAALSELSSALRTVRRSATDDQRR